MRWAFFYYGRPLREMFTNRANLSPYVALKPEQRFDELNPAQGPNAQASLELNFDMVDAAGEDTFNRILWSIMKGSQPYPGTKRMSSLDIARGH
jgi:hypothetical protein